MFSSVIFKYVVEVWAVYMWGAVQPKQWRVEGGKKKKKCNYASLYWKGKKMIYNVANKLSWCFCYL